MSNESRHSSRPPRTIVLCFDGTDSQFDSTNTNVVKFFDLLKKDRPDQQVTYYQAGIGTYFAPGAVSPLLAWIASLLDQAVAWCLDEHVMEGYNYLMETYHHGDKVCLFGFSRGAYTARALAGMLHKVGLLPKDNIQQVGFAYKAYKRTDKEGIKLAAGFKKTFSQEVRVEFVGVWDTVQSTGILFNKTLPFTYSNSAVKVFRHALALDERRSRFRPNLYHWPAQDDESDSVAVSMTEPTLKRPIKSKDSTQPHGRNPSQTGKRSRKVPLDETRSQTNLEEFTPDVQEVWFAGCHSDIGGGNVEDDVVVSLAQITLHWMVEQVLQSQCGILFDSHELARIGFTCPPTSPPGSADLIAFETTRDSVTNGSTVQALPTASNQPPPGPEAYPEHLDAIAPIFDDLKLTKSWWLLEVLPCSNIWQDHDGKWHNKWRMNLGRGRIIPSQKPKFHHTVKQRMEYESLKYKPRAIYHDEIYV